MKLSLLILVGVIVVFAYASPKHSASHKTRKNGLNGKATELTRSSLHRERALPVVVRNHGAAKLGTRTVHATKHRRANKYRSNENDSHDSSSGHGNDHSDEGSGNGNGKPGSGPGNPGNGNGYPGTGNGNPGNGPGKPGNGNGYPGNDNGKPGNGHVNPGNGNGNPGNGNGNGNPGNGNGNPGNGNGNPGNGHGNPGNDNGKPGNGNGKPGNSHEEYDNGHGKPGNGHGKPGNSHENSHEEHDNGHGKPDNGHGKPGNSHENSHEEHDNGHGKPGNSHESQEHDDQKNACFVRRLLRTVSVVTITTLSSVPGYIDFPVAHFELVAEGTKDKSTGVPYIYAHKHDQAVEDLKHNGTSSILVSQANVEGCCNNCCKYTFGSRDVKCKKAWLAGQVVRVDTNEYEFAKKAILEKKPEYAEVDDKNYVLLKLDVTAVFIEGETMGSVVQLSVKEYFYVDPLRCKFD